MAGNSSTISRYEPTFEHYEKRQSGTCSACGDPWPCAISRLLAERAALLDVAEAAHKVQRRESGAFIGLAGAFAALDGLIPQGEPE